MTLLHGDGTCEKAIRRGGGSTNLNKCKQECLKKKNCHFVLFENGTCTLSKVCSGFAKASNAKTWKKVSKSSGSRIIAATSAAEEESAAEISTTATTTTTTTTAATSTTTMMTMTTTTAARMTNSSSIAVAESTLPPMSESTESFWGVTHSTTPASASAETSTSAMQSHSTLAPVSEMVLATPADQQCCLESSRNLITIHTDASMEDCMDLCISQTDCSYADWELGKSASLGLCRTLADCMEPAACTAHTRVLFKKVKQGKFNSPQWMMECPHTPVMKTECLSEQTFNDAIMSVEQLMRRVGTHCNTTHCQQADLAGCILRMAGHDFMDFDVKTGKGGSDGCTDMDDDNNAGLAECLYQGEFEGLVSLSDAYKLFCNRISLADFTVLAAQTVMHYLAKGEARDIMGDGFRSNFRYGRTTASEGCKHSIGVLPKPEDSCDGVEHTFVKALGLTWEESAALMGAHTLGRAQQDFSGFRGWWSDKENSRIFSHNYFVSMYAKGWCEELNVNNCTSEKEAAGGCSPKNQWQRCDVLRDEVQHEMMLNTDLCLAYGDGKGGDGVLRSGEDNCCAWVRSNEEKFNMTGVIAANENYFCSVQCGSQVAGTADTFDCLQAHSKQSDRETAACCSFETGRQDCGSSGLGQTGGKGGPAEEAVRRFAEDETYWAKSLLRAWKKVTENGFDDLKSVGDC